MTTAGQHEVRADRENMVVMVEDGQPCGKVGRL